MLMCFHHNKFYSSRNVKILNFISSFQMESQLETTKSMEERFSELQTQYDALLEMYGEKEEEAQELRLDLQDVKEMYKVQIDDLLRQQKGSS